MNEYRMASFSEPLLNEISKKRKKGKEFGNLLPRIISRKNLDLPSLSESEVVRHYTRLSQMNYGIDTGIYPLGSCTMKYNPKIMEEMANSDAVTNMNPYQDESTIQGCLQIIYELERMLCEITGMHSFSLQPSAGAHGEFLGMLLVRAYHGDTKRNQVILPDSAHGTNPASAKMAGYEVIEIPSKNGIVDLEILEEALSEKTACFILTNPNTLGIFESEILEIAELVHENGALLYYDGANMNAIMGKARPGDMGFDIVHLNLHKTFSTPHGGGGPGAGPIGVKKFLEKFLPVPRIVYDGSYHFDYDHPYSIGKISSFYGNFAVLLKAYLYIILMGGNGLKEASEIAVLNANYMKEKLLSHYSMPYRSLRKHEFVVSCEKLKEKGIRALDVAKRLLDYGLHPPTIYFPLIVLEALMIEPTETESKKSLDEYINALIKIAEENPEIVKKAPHDAPVKRVDEIKASRDPILSWKDLG